MNHDPGSTFNRGGGASVGYSVNIPYEESVEVVTCHISQLIAIREPPPSHACSPNDLLPPPPLLLIFCSSPPPPSSNPTSLSLLPLSATKYPLRCPPTIHDC